MAVLRRVFASARAQCVSWAPLSVSSVFRSNVLSLILGLLAAASAIVFGNGCRATNGTEGRFDGGGTPDAASDASTPYPAPRTDLVTAVGSETTFELATWNVENFPKNASTPKVLADLIASLDLDMVAIEEVQDIDAFNEVVARLRDYDSLLSSDTYSDGSYQKVGYIYKKDLVTLSAAFLLFTQDGYQFPRPPIKVDVVVHGPTPWSFTAIGLHLKAGGGFNDRDRRKDAIVILEDFLRATVDGTNGDKIAVIGDYNETFERGTSVFGPLTRSPERYTFRTKGNDTAGDFSFIPSSALIDHIVTTKAFDEAFGTGMTIIPRLDRQMNNYEGQVSDHLPVIMRLPL